MTKQSILIVRNASKADFGGGERYPVYLAEELVKNNFDVLLCSSHKRIKELSRERKVSFNIMPWIPLQNFSGFRNILLPIYFIWQLYLLIWYVYKIIRLKVSVVHLQSKDDFIAGTLAAKLLHRVVIWTDHADLKYVLQNTNKPLKNPIGKIVKYVSGLADKVIVVSNNELGLIEKSTGTKTPNNFTVVYNGIADIEVLPARNFSKDTILFVATSRLVSNKGIYELINATKRLYENGYNVKTLLLGEGPEEKDMKKLSSDSVVFLGFPKNYLSIVKGSDIFVHPSYNEGFSLSLVEAAMLAMPVITTKVGGNPEIITNRLNGLLVEPHDEEDLYRAMKWSIEHIPKMQKFSKALRKDYLNRFQFDDIVKHEIIPMYTGNV